MEEISSYNLLMAIIFYLCYYLGSTLGKKFPEIITMPRTIKDFYYKSLIFDIRHITDDATFNSIIENTIYKKIPEKLQKLKESIEKDLSTMLFYDQVQCLKGKEIYVWGGGEIYGFRKHLFSMPKI